MPYSLSPWCLSVSDLAYWNDWSNNWAKIKSNSIRIKWRDKVSSLNSSSSDCIEENWCRAEVRSDLQIWSLMTNPIRCETCRSTRKLHLSKEQCSSERNQTIDQKILWECVFSHQDNHLSIVLISSKKKTKSCSIQRMLKHFRSIFQIELEWNCESSWFQVNKCQERSSSRISVEEANL